MDNTKAHYENSVRDDLIDALIFLCYSYAGQEIIISQFHGDIRAAIRAQLNTYIIRKVN